MSMKNMVKKTVVFLLSVVCLLGMAACGSSKDNGAKLHQTLQSSDRLTAISERVCNVDFPQDAKLNIAQGGYTDGKYFYQAFINVDKESEEADNDACIIKYDMENREVVAQSAEYAKLNHANDIAYNSKEDYFVVSNCHYNPDIVTILDPEDFSVIETVQLEMNISAIAYNESRDCYVVELSGVQQFCFLDSEFKQTSEIFEPDSCTEGYVTQGICTDDEYIYFSLYRENVIGVYDWEGNFVTLIELDLPSDEYEPENISVVGNDIYIGGYNWKLKWQIVYKLTDLKIAE